MKIVRQNRSFGQSLTVALLLIANLLFSQEASVQDKKDSTDYYALMQTRLTGLRSELAAQQTLWPELVSKLNGDAPSLIEQALIEQRPTVKEIDGLKPFFSDLLEEKRNKLRLNLQALVKQGTCSATILALQQAEVETLLKDIRFIEDEIGTRSGAYSTRYNVFSADNLRSLDVNVTRRIADIMEEEARLPKPYAHHLVLRRQLLEKWQRDIKSEIKQRTDKQYAVLKNIDDSRSVSDLEKLYKDIQNISAEDHVKSYEKNLKFQIALFSDQLPADMSLGMLKKQIVSGKLIMPKDKSAFDRSKNRGPPNGSTYTESEIRQIVNAAILEEQHAIEKGNNIEIAKARAALRINQQRLRIMYGSIEKPVMSFDHADSETLLEVLKLYRDHSKELIKKIPQNIVDINEIKIRIEEISVVLRARHNGFGYDFGDMPGIAPRGPPPTDPRDNYTKASRVPSQQIELFESKYDEHLDRFLLIELQKIKDTRLAGNIPDVSLTDEINRIKTKLGLQPESPNQAKLVISISPQKETSKPGKMAYGSMQDIEVKSTEPYPQGFDKKFPNTEPKNFSRKELIKPENIKSAPGGVIIDVSLPDSFLSKIQSVHIDLIDYQMYVQMADFWYPVNLPRDPSLLRQSWAFASDGRVVGVDLSNLSIAETRYWLQNTKSNDLANTAQLLKGVTKVNLHPALENTRWGEDFILGDQVIFNLLPRQTFEVEGPYRKFPCDLHSLKKAFISDQFEDVLMDRTSRYSISKSIISISNVGVVIDSCVNLKPILEMALYQKKDSLFREVKETSAWFSSNVDCLEKNIPVLQSIKYFAASVAIVKACKQLSIPNNCSELEFLPLNTDPTPDLLYQGKLDFKDVIHFFNNQP